ncbi:hypothetical protein [Desulfotomaculum copahuensis]|uniref:Uncharacterized protein n=1 Tax=Desulfotomaculum copahuensis TaxID=1838280 RepID=A0A1B7LHJ6_9FIRM|nr:hypothetical protein [Desulfotomaculum copahuensis]OAT85587.1 hypothetical protein A6M21_05575 [Desulfotomaculum copahuensis]
MASGIVENVYKQYILLKIKIKNKKPVAIFNSTDHKRPPAVKYLLALLAVLTDNNANGLPRAYQLKNKNGKIFAARFCIKGSSFGQ